MFDLRIRGAEKSSPKGKRRGGAWRGAPGAGPGGQREQVPGSRMHREADARG